MSYCPECKKPLPKAFDYAPDYEIYQCPHCFVELIWKPMGIWGDN